MDERLVLLRIEGLEEVVDLAWMILLDGAGVKGLGFPYPRCGDLEFLGRRFKGLALRSRDGGSAARQYCWKQGSDKGLAQKLLPVPVSNLRSGT